MNNNSLTSNELSITQNKTKNEQIEEVKRDTQKPSRINDFFALI